MRPPHRILLLTFTRRAAESILHRVQTIRSHPPAKKPKGGNNDLAAARKVWGGTFHASGARLLRIHGAAIGVDPRFTIHDQTDAADLLDVIRTELKLAENARTSPRRGPARPPIAAGSTPA